MNDDLDMTEYVVMRYLDPDQEEALKDDPIEFKNQLERES